MYNLLVKSIIAMFLVLSYNSCDAKVDIKVYHGNNAYHVPAIISYLEKPLDSIDLIKHQRAIEKNFSKKNRFLEHYISITKNHMLL